MMILDNCLTRTVQRITSRVMIQVRCMRVRQVRDVTEAGRLMTLSLSSIFVAQFKDHFF
jgi:hypothetical protein